jgi:hypothetical protein
MEDIIIETDEEREFVNCMKIFARFNSPKNHINMVNSLLLEKNIRELLVYMKEAKKQGKYDLTELNKRTKKQIFKLLTDKMTDDLTSTGEDFVFNEEYCDFNKKMKNKRHRETVLQELERDDLRPKRCYGISLSIPLCKGYNCLNEKERILVEKIGIYPQNFLSIKKAFLEEKCIQGKIDPPNSYSQTFKSFWYN